MCKKDASPDTSEDTLDTAKAVSPFETVLKCKLTDAETLAYAREMTEVQANVTELQDELKSLAAEYKAKIAAKEARRDILCKYVSTGYEYREVKCERLYDYVQMTVTERRLDGQEPEVLGVRAMTPNETQRQLDLDK